MNLTAPSAELDMLGQIAQQAADMARDARPTRIDVKATQDFVTDMDRTMEDMIRARLQTAFPGIAIFGEESLGPEDRLHGDGFLVDPLDGTGNWIAGLPFTAVSLARVRDGVTVQACVVDIAHRRCYLAQDGAGAWCDGLALVQPAAPPALMALSTGLLERTHAAPAAFRDLRRYGKLRNLGAQALQLCLVAQGSLAFTASCEAKLWDDAAGRLIVTEAGARYHAAIPVDPSPRPAQEQRSLAAHPAIFDAVQTLLDPLFAV